MESFNEYLGNLLTDCRNNALEELRSNERYAERKKIQADLRAKLEALISPEATDLLEEYAEAGVHLNGFEYNAVIVCGLTAQSEIQKRFDASTPEYRAFLREYI